MAERILGLDPSATTYPDSDNDGLNDIEEFKLGTDRFNPDTDGDGLLDGEEVQGRSMPHLYSHQERLMYPSYESRSIYDDEGNWVDMEYTVIYPDPPIYNSDPLKKDSDGDGYSDHWELSYSLDPKASVVILGSEQPQQEWHIDFESATGITPWDDADGGSGRTRPFMENDTRNEK